MIPQSVTGIMTESRVKQKLESLGLIVRKPIPDIGIDFEVFSPVDRSKCARIQVKGRNPKMIKTYRWFQLRIQKSEMEFAKSVGMKPDETWRKKLDMIDFFILDAVFYDEMWVLTREQTLKLISLNKYQYGLRPDNIFFYENPIKGKQKEMNLEAQVPGIPIIEQFKSCRNNFVPILNFLGLNL
jgi:hypothetical protein